MTHRLSRRSLLRHAGAGVAGLATTRLVTARDRRHRRRRRTATAAGRRHLQAVLPAAADPQGPDRLGHHAGRTSRRRADPAGRPDPHVDLQRDLPRAHHPPPVGQADHRDRPPRAAGRGGDADDPPPRLALRLATRRPARAPADQAPQARAPTSTSTCEDGKPERAAMQWYHDHSHHHTSRNSWMGLAGLFILDDEFEDAAAPAARRYELPLFLTDRRFDANEPARHVAVRHAGREPRGQRRRVPGQRRPAALRRGRAPPVPAARPQRLGLPHLQPGADRRRRLHAGCRGDADRHRERAAARAGQAGRRCCSDRPSAPTSIVDFSEFAGTTAHAGVGRADERVRLGRARRPRPGAVPRRHGPRRRAARRPRASCARCPSGWPTRRSSPSRVWAFGTGYDVDDRATSRTRSTAAPSTTSRVDAQVELDSVETWMLLNTTTRTHYIHIHDVDWVVLSRNGAPPEPHEAGLKETFLLDPGEYVTVAAKFTDHLGRYMIHCHMLDHEDGGMMAAWEVVKPGAGTADDPDRRRAAPRRHRAGRDAQPPGLARAPRVLEALPLSRVQTEAEGSPYRCTLPDPDAPGDPPCPLHSSTLGRILVIVAARGAACCCRPARGAQEVPPPLPVAPGCPRRCPASSTASGGKAADDLVLQTLTHRDHGPHGDRVAPDGRVIFAERQGAIKVITTKGETVEAGRILVNATGCVGLPRPDAGGGWHPRARGVAEVRARTGASTSTTRCRSASASAASVPTRRSSACRRSC